jgi:hypothetical protein
VWQPGDGYPPRAARFGLLGPGFRALARVQGDDAIGTPLALPLSMETTNTEPTTTESYWAAQHRREAEKIAAHAGKILEVNRRTAGYDGDYYDVFDILIWNGGEIESMRVGVNLGQGLKADASREAVDAANDWLEEREYARLVALDLDQAKKPAKGRIVVVNRGRKVPKGTEGLCFWTGVSTWGEKLGIAPLGADGKPTRGPDGKYAGAVFVAASNCDALCPDEHMSDDETIRLRAKSARRIRYTSGSACHGRTIAPAGHCSECGRAAR